MAKQLTISAPCKNWPKAFHPLRKKRHQSLRMQEADLCSLLKLSLPAEKMRGKGMNI